MASAFPSIRLSSLFRPLHRVPSARPWALGLLALAALGLEARAQSRPAFPASGTSPWDIPFAREGLPAGPVAARHALAPSRGSGLGTYRKDDRMVLDWTVSAPGPMRFRVFRPDGRFIALRSGRRSVQGWIASVRVVGWPRGVYLVEAEAGPVRSMSKFLLR